MKLWSVCCFWKKANGSSNVGDPQVLEGGADRGLISWPRLASGGRVGEGPEVGTVLVTQGTASQLTWPEWREQLKGAGKGRGDKGASCDPEGLAFLPGAVGIHGGFSALPES